VIVLRLLRILGLSCCAVALAAAAALPASAATAANWALRQLPPSEGSAPWGPSLDGVSYPTESLCVAVGALGTLAFSQAPTGGPGAWHVVNPAGKPAPD
jgi:hypothetical protein